MDILHPLRTYRRRRLLQTPLSSDWTRLIDQHASVCGRLNAAERHRLDGLIHVFLTEKRFEGCNGLRVTDRMRLTIAAHACLLLLNLRHDFYADLSSILVYPADFVFEDETDIENGASLVEVRDASGLSTHQSAVVLAWADVVDGARHPENGLNVVFHEFAHRLTLRHRATALTGRAACRNWARTLAVEYETRVQSTSPDPLIDDYATTDSEEFFAVITELFFTIPFDLQRVHPTLYHAFQQFYGQDPAAHFRHARKV